MNHSRLLVASVAVALVGLVASCVDGDNPTGLNLNGTASLAVVPRFAPGPQSAEAAVINRIRITARLASDGTILATFVVDVDATADEWDLQLDIPIPAGGGSVVLTIELVSVDAATGVETVQWTGQSAAIPLQPGQPREVKEVQVVRGGSENLAVTAISVSPDSSQVLEGDSVLLSATVTKSDPTVAAQVFWTSLDTGVAVVAGNGMVHARLPGVARIVAQAGAPADTVRVVVVGVPAAVVVSPANMVLTSPETDAVFDGQVVDARGASISGEALSWASLDPSLLESLGDGRFRPRRAGTTAVVARSVSNPGLSDTSRVVLDFAVADLALTKTAVVTEITAGDTVSFTVTVANQGPDDAGAFTVADFAPSGMAYVAGVVSDGAVTTDPLRWSMPGLVSGGSATWRLDFFVEVPDEPLLSNAAEILEAATHDPDPSNDRDVHQLAVATEADIGVTVTVTPAAVLPGDTAGIRTVVTNNGPGRARDVVVLVTLPVEVRTRSTLPSVGTFDADAGAWTLTSLAPGDSATLDQGVTVANDAPESLIASATLAPGRTPSDPNPDNDEASDTLLVSPSTVDLTVLKSFGSDQVLEGDTLTWTVAVINGGPGAALALRIADSLDATGFLDVVVVDSLRARSTAPGSAADTIVVDSLGVGDTARITFKGVVRPGVAPDTLWNRAWVAGLDPLLQAVSPDDDADSAWVATRSNVADLELAKRAAPDTVFAGDTIRYTVVLWNRGPATARDVEVLDTFDVTRFFSYAVTLRGNGMTGALPGRLATDSLVAGDSAFFVLTAVADRSSEGVTVLNRASVTRAVGTRDTIPTNDTASVSRPIRARLADLSVRKTVSKDTAAVGDTLVFQVLVSNQGGVAVTAFDVEDVLDAGSLSDLTVNDRVGLTGPVPGVLTGASLAPGATARITYSGVVVASAEETLVRNRAAVVAAVGAADPEPGNDADSTGTWIVNRRTDLVVTKAASRATLVAGDTVVYTVQVQNLGPAATRGVVVADTLPAGFELVSTTATLGSWADGEWVVDSLGTEASETLTIRMVATTSTPLGKVWNRARLTSDGSAEDTVAANNVDSVSVDVLGVDLRVAKVSSNPSPAENESFTYTVAVKNIATASATGVVVKDVLPAGVVYEGHTADLGGWDPNPAVGNWIIGTMAPGDSATLIIQVHPDNGTATTAIENVAFVATAAPADVDLANDTARAPITVASPDMFEVLKTSSNPTPAENQSFSYRVKVTNVGPVVVTGITLHDTIPTGIVYESHGQSMGSYDPNPLIARWNVGTLNPGDSAYLDINAHPANGTAGSTIENRAWGSADQTDGTPANDMATLPITVASPDMFEVTKTTSNVSPAENQSFSYRVKVTNVGPVVVTGITLHDTIPTGVVYESHGQSMGSYDPNPLIARWDVGTLNPGDSAYLDINAHPANGTAGSTIENRAWGSADQTDGFTANDTAAMPVTISAPDMFEVLKTSSNPTPAENQSFSYRVKVTNVGPVVVTGITLYDTIPTGVVYESHGQSMGSYDPNPLIARWNVGTLNPGDSAYLDINAHPANGTAGSTIENWAWGSADQTDGTPANDMATLPITVASPDMFEVTKTTSNVSPAENQSFSYRVKVTNVGPVVVTGITLHDTIPTGVVYESHGQSMGSYDPNPLIARWDVGTLNPGDSAYLDINAHPANGTAGSTIENRAWGSADQTDGFTANDTAAMPVTISAPDMFEVLKTSSNPTPAENQSFSYRVKVTNVGPVVVTGITLYDTIPTGVVYESHGQSMGSYDPNPLIARWNVGTLNPGDSAYLDINAHPANGTAGSTIENWAWGSADQTDGTPANDMATLPITVASPDMFEVAKTSSDASPVESVPFDYRVRIWNVGPSTLTGVTVYDTIPTGMALVATSVSAGSYTPEPAVSRWDVGDMAPGDSAWLTITVQPMVGTATTTITNRAWGSADQSDLVTANNQASVPLTVAAPDMFDVAKTVSNTSPAENELFTYRIRIWNVGPATLGSVTVSDTVPSGLNYQSHAASAGDYDPNPAVSLWTVPPLTPGDSAWLTVDVRPAVGTAATTIVNRAWGDAAQTDTFSVNNADSATIMVAGADLQVAKTTSDALPVEFEVFTYTAKVKNVGAAGATSVQLFDTVPTGIELIGSAVTQGSYPSAPGVWDVGSLAAGDSALLTLTVRPQSGTAGDAPVNTASVLSLAEPDDNAANDTASVGITVMSTDALEVAKTTSTAAPAEREDFTFTVVVRNIGPDTITGVSVLDTLATGLSLLGSSTTRGSYDGTTWTPGTLAAGEADTLSLSVEADSATATASLTNTAVATLDQTDANLANNSASATVVPTGDDYLEVTKTVDDTVPFEGDPVTYTVKVKNIGAGDVSNVLVYDTLDAEYDNLDFTSATPTQGSYADATGLWTVGALTPGDSAVLTLVASPAAESRGSTIRNTAWAYAGETETNTVNDSASVDIVVTGVDLELSKTVDAPAVTYMDTVTFTISLFNNGPSTATNVVVRDTLTSALVPLTWTPSVGAYDTATGNWGIGSLGWEASATLTITARAEALGSTTNLAELISVDQTDYNATNDQATQVVTAAADTVDLRLTKQAITGEGVAVGDVITYRLNFSQWGPDKIPFVQIADTLAAEGTVVAVRAPEGTTWDGTTWSLTNPAESTTVSLEIDVQVDSAAAAIGLTNIAAIVPDTLWADPFGNANADTTYVFVDGTFLSVTKSVTNPTPVEGDSVYFIINAVATDGDWPSSTTQITDILPAGLTFVDYTATSGTYDDATGIWNVGSVGGEPGDTLYIRANVDAGTAGSTITNQAQLTSSYPVDTDPADNTDTVSIVPMPLDLRLTKTEKFAQTSVQTAAKDTVVYILTVQNDSAGTATGVVVHDTVPANVTFLSVYPDTASFSVVGGVGEWLVGELRGGYRSIEVTAEVDAELLAPDEDIVNRIAVFAVDQTEADPTNDTTSYTLTTTPGPLSIRTATSLPATAVGVPYSVTFEAIGGDPPYSWSMIELDLPTGVTFNESTGVLSGTPTTSGSYAPNIGVMDSGEGSFDDVFYLNVAYADASNPLDGTTANQVIGWLNPADSTPDPSGASYRLEVLQSFAAGDNGTAFGIAVPLMNNDGATGDVVLEMWDGPPGDESSMGTFTLPASAFVGVSPADASTWPIFDFTGGGITFSAESTYAFSLRSSSTLPLTFPRESTSGYAGGAAYQRNVPVSATWSATGQDFGFRVWAFPAPPP